MNDSNILAAIHEELVALKEAVASQKPVMDIDDFVQYTGLSKGYVYKLTHANKVPYYKPGGKKLFFKRAEVDTWLLSNRVSTDDEFNQQVQGL